MKLKKYSHYKGSGIDWIGDIPEDWLLLPIRGLCETGRGRVISNLDIGDNEGIYPVYSSQTSNNGEMGKLNTYDFNGEYVTWTTDGANAGTVFYRNGKFNCTNVCGTLKQRPNKLIMMTYLPYVLNQGTKLHVRYDINPKLMNDVMARIRIPLPPLQTQQRISSFLDSKTVQIENLIEKDKKLIELLKERRVSLINKAVTKGLDDSVKMKDSGVEWIGEIPESWEVNKMKHLLKINITDGPHETPEFLDEGIPFISAEAIKNSKIDFNYKRGYISLKDHKRYSLKCKPQLNDIFMIKSGATTGNIAMVETEEEFNIWSPLALMRVNEKIEAKLLFYNLLSFYFKEQVKLGWSFGTQENIGMGVIQNLDIITPKNIQEQQKIVEFLDKETEKIDNHIKKVEKRIELYEEYKKSLIYNVVTGKVEV